MTTWATIQARLALFCGLGTTASTTQKAQLEAFALLRLETAVSRAWWPNLMKIEQRSYAPLYDVAETYAAAAQVWDGANAYYSSLQGSNTGHALTETAWWQQLTEIDAVIPLAQDGETVIGTFFDAYATEAHAIKRKAPLAAAIVGGNIYITDNQGPAAPWLRFRAAVPDVTASGEGVTPDPVPDELVQYIILGAYADWLNDQGKVDSAARKENDAELGLQNAVTQQIDQQGEQTPTHVSVPSAPIPGYYYRGQ